jgi:hypothetical protein
MGEDNEPSVPMAISRPLKPENEKFDIASVRARAVNDLKNFKVRTEGKIIKTPFGGVYRYFKLRPDVTFLLAVIAVLVGAIMVYQFLPYFKSNTPKYTTEQITRASKLTMNDFTVKELATAELKTAATKAHRSMFVSRPYSLENSGVYSMVKGSAILTIVIFFLMYILPFLLIAYGIWFIIRYFPYVWAAAWGWFVAMYKYFSTKIEGTLGCKWYIRLAMGWRCRRNVNFMDYFNAWKRQYIDRPVYIESLNYLKFYIRGKRKYIEEPYERYIRVPLETTLVYLKYLKRIYIDRVMAVLLGKLRSLNGKYVQKPREEFYYDKLGEQDKANPDTPAARGLQSP